jgi:Kazal-type serine protease inhibitor domain
MSWRKRTLAVAGYLALMSLTGCAEEPVVTLGGLIDAAVATDEDSMIDEAERERLFRDLAERECQENEPVCATDGATYRNICQAIANGAQMVHAGPC